MKSSMVLCPRRYISSFILYFVGVLSGIILYSVLMLNRRFRPKITGSFFTPPRNKISRDSPMVFVGGHPRSGTTLMRVLLDAHPSFHCGQETHIIPSLLTLHQKYSHSRVKNRLSEAGLDLGLINATVADAISNIITNHGPPSRRLCSKDPFTLKHIPYLSHMFPKAQFILMVRDGRGVIHSIRKNNVKILHFPKSDRQALKRWNQVVDIMYNGCLDASAERCIIIHYESLVLEPRFWLAKILQFLDVSWSDSVLKHAELIGVPGGIPLSRYKEYEQIDLLRKQYGCFFICFILSIINVLFV